MCLDTDTCIVSSYNSVVFNETNVYEYTLFATTANITNTTLAFGPTHTYEFSSLERLDIKRLHNSRCIQAYGKQLMTDRDDVIWSLK